MTAPNRVERESAIESFWRDRPRHTVGQCDQDIADHFGTSLASARAARLRLYKGCAKPWNDPPEVSDRQAAIAIRLRARMLRTRATVSRVNLKTMLAEQTIENVLNHVPVEDFCLAPDDVLASLESFLEGVDPIGATLTMVREAAGFSQADVAKAIGTSVFSLSKWERGTRRPRADKTVHLWSLYQKKLGTKLKLEWMIQGNVDAVRAFCEARA